MHKMIKLVITFSVIAFFAGIVLLSNVAPPLNQILKWATLLSTILALFFGVSYSVRGENSDADNKDKS